LLADVVERVLLAGGDVVREARFGHVRVRAAEFLHRHLFAGDGLDDVRAGDEHLAGLVDHDDEVGQRGGVHMATRGGTHDQRDLRDDARCFDVVVKDVAVQAQRDDALLDPRPAALVDADDRAAVLHREVEHLDDLLAVHLAEAAAEHRRVLAEDADVAAVDGAVAGDHAVAERPVLLQPEVRAAVPGQRVEFDERVLVEQRQDALTGRQLALGVDLLDRLLANGVQRFLGALLEVGQLPGGRVDVDLVLGLTFYGIGNARHGSRCYLLGKSAIEGVWVGRPAEQARPALFLDARQQPQLTVTHYTQRAAWQLVRIAIVVARG